MSFKDTMSRIPPTDMATIPEDAELSFPVIDQGDVTIVFMPDVPQMKYHDALEMTSQSGMSQKEYEESIKAKGLVVHVSFCLMPSHCPITSTPASFNETWLCSSYLIYPSHIPIGETNDTTDTSYHFISLLCLAGLFLP